MLLCVLSSGVEGVGITILHYIGYQGFWAAPKGMAFGLFMSEMV